MNGSSIKIGRWGRAISIVMVSLLAIAAVSCSLNPKERANPLDPMNPVEPFQLTLSLVYVAADTGTVRKIQLDWQDINHTALREYHVFRRPPVPIGDYDLIAVTLPGTTTFLDTESIVEDPYLYRVAAMFGDGADSVLSDRINYMGEYDDRY